MLKQSTTKLSKTTYLKADLELLGSLFIGYLHENSSNLMCLINSLQKLTTNKSATKAIKAANALEHSLKETRDLINQGVKKEFRVDHEIKKCIETLIFYIKEKQINVKYDSKSLKLFGYSHIFRQILICVLLNSIEAFKEKSKTNFLEIKLESSDNNYKIIIIDNAGGIEESVLRKLFLPKKSKKRDGTGLGLYFASKSIHDFFNGSLSLESELGKGTATSLIFKT